MNEHPEAGVLRAWLDGERPDITAHVNKCSQCRGLSERQGIDAQFAAATLVSPPASVDVDAALAAARPDPSGAVVPIEHRGRRMRWNVRAAAAVALVVAISAVTVTPGGRAYATDFPDRFRSEQIAVVPVDFATVDPAALQSLVDVAQIQGLEDVEAKEVSSLAEAEEISGIAAARLDPASLPESISGPVRVMAHAPRTVRIDFADNAELPRDIRDATLVVQVPGAVVQLAGNEETQAVIRGEAGNIEVAVEGGPTLAQVREALLSLPGLPAETVSALRAIENWETTMPLPVPVRQIAWENTTINGKRAFAFGDETGIASAVLWRDGDRFIGVGGTIPRSDVERIAEVE